MADKNFGVKKIELIGSSGTPNLTSPNNLNLNAVTVAISTDVTIGGKVQSDVIVGTGYSVGIGSTQPSNTLQVEGSSYLRGNVGIGGTLTIQQTTEVFDKKTGATGIVTHDFSTGSIWYHSGISNNFTLNLTNVPIEENRAITISLFLDQGVVGRYANGFQVDGVSQTIRWANDALPTPSTLKLDVQSFTLIRVDVGAGVTWKVLGQLLNYN